MRAPTNRTGWPSLLAWGIASLLLTLTLVGAASIGMFVAPFAIMAIVVAARRNRDWPEAALGSLVGAGAVCLFVAYGSRGYSACPPTGTPIWVGPGEHFACGGLNPAPWLTVALLLAGVGLAVYILFRRSHRGAAT